MDSEINFEEIRPYRDGEVPEKIAELLSDSTFLKVLAYLFKDSSELAQVIENLRKIKSVKEFQLALIRPFFKRVAESSTDGVTISGFDNFDIGRGSLFISNHRDIILDSALLNICLYDNDLESTEIAIGSNLLIYPWIDTLVRLNKSFKVKRDIPIKQMLESSKVLSSYIRDCVTVQNNSVWIAQKEGRAKDGNDKTQVSLLKMFNMSNSGTPTEGFGELNIVPLSISYEIEPVGKQKVLELINKRHIEGFKKSTQDDIDGMTKGLTDMKGRVHFQFGSPIDVSDLAEIGNKNLQIKEIANRVDREIYQNYRLWPNNYIAYDMVDGSNKYCERYTPEEKSSFIKLREDRLKDIAVEHMDEAFDLWNRMYSMPVVNKENIVE